MKGKHVNLVLMVCPRQGLCPECENFKYKHLPSSVEQDWIATWFMS